MQATQAVAVGVTPICDPGNGARIVIKAIKT